MKFLNLALVLSSVNLAISMSVNALFDKTQCNDELCYMISGPEGGKATLVGFSPKNKDRKKVVIPKTVTFEGYIYTVDSVGYSAFSGNRDVREVTISRGIENLAISYEAFYNCPNLRKVNFDNKSYSVNDLTAFGKPNKNAIFDGVGVKAFTDDQVAKLLAKFNFGRKDYSKVSFYERKVDLFNLGRALNKYLTLDKFIYDEGNAITAIKTQLGTYDSYARLYRLLAVQMGIPEDEMLIANDADGHFWNYVKLEGQWYNADTSTYKFNKVSEYWEAEWKQPFFECKDAFKNTKKITTSPAQWNVMLHLYGYGYEHKGKYLEKADAYLNENDLGSRC